MIVEKRRGVAVNEALFEESPYCEIRLSFLRETVLTQIKKGRIEMNKKKTLLHRFFLYASLAILLTSSNSNCFGYSWEKTYGGTRFDTGAYAQQTSDGNYIIIGTLNHNDSVVNEKICLVKFI